MGNWQGKFKFDFYERWQKSINFHFLPSRAHLFSRFRLKSVQTAQIFCTATSMKENIPRRSKFTTTTLECPRAEWKFIFHLFIFVHIDMLVIASAARFSIEFHRLAAHLRVDKLVIERKRVGIQCGARCRVKFQFLRCHNHWQPQNEIQIITDEMKRKKKYETNLKLRKSLTAFEHLTISRPVLI